MNDSVGTGQDGIGNTGSVSNDRKTDNLSPPFMLRKFVVEKLVEEEQQPLAECEEVESCCEADQRVGIEENLDSGQCSESSPEATSGITVSSETENQGKIRTLTNQANEPLHEAIQSLEQLNRRIDAFRQSPLWLNSSNVREEVILLTKPNSYATTLLSPDVVQDSKQVTATTTEANKSKLLHSTALDVSSSTEADSCTVENPGNRSVERIFETKPITFESGVQMIQDLLLDTQQQCIKMVNENQRTATRFDDELGRCQNQMDVLRKELAYAHRCVNDLEVNMMINGSATESDNELLSAEHAMEAEIHRLRDDNARLRSQFRLLQRELIIQRQNSMATVVSTNTATSSSTNSSSQQRHHSDSDSSSPRPHQPFLGQGIISQQIGRIQSSNQHQHNSLDARCSMQNNNLVDEDSDKTISTGACTAMDAASFTNLQLELIHAREALIALKHDRKRLKAEKVELLNQMKEVYQTLEAKERELRDFIRQFEQKMRESDKGIKELIWEKEKIEKEKRQLSDALESANQKCEQCKAEMEKEKMENSKLQAQLKELQGRFVLITGQQPQVPPSAPDQLPNSPPSNGHRPTLTSATPGSLGYVSLTVSPANQEKTSSEPQDHGHVKDSSIFTPEEAAVLRRRKPQVMQCDDEKRSSKMHSQIHDSVYEDVGTAFGSSQSANQHLALLRRGRESGRKYDTPRPCSQERPSSNRLSRLFHFTSVMGGRSKSKDDHHKNPDIDRSSSTFAVDAIAADLNLVEKADQLLQARQIPMARWRQSHVVAWLELELGMYAYTGKFTDNVKSGKVLLSLSDHEIEHVLGVSTALHKKKLRLAIEEYRAPALCKFPAIKEVTNQYVCRQWLPSIGLPQYVQSFRQQLIDGRLMNYLNKKQLDKYLGVSRRFHQLSILKGIEILRLFNFDIKALSKRRLECERENADLLVWTNARFGKWCEQIDLGEYADNLSESGIHGGLCILDPSFTIDTLSTAMGIPNGRQMVRKHLAAEFLPLLNQARAQLENDQARGKSHGHRSGGSLGRAFSRSYTISGDQEFSTPPGDSKQQRLSCKRRRGLRGSIGRVFGLRVRRSTANTTSDDPNGNEEISPARSITMANLENRNPMLSNDMQPQNTSTPANASSPKPLTRSTGTLSSTTSDLGSSIERSQHMKTILGTPKVLTQPPLTKLNSSSKNNIISNNTGMKTSASDAADLSRLQHLCLSPGEVLLNGSNGVHSRNPLVRLRNKARGDGAVPKMGLGASGLVDITSTRSPGSAPARPHSVGDFGGLASYYFSPNSYSNYAYSNQSQQPEKRIQSKSTNGTHATSESCISFSPRRLQSWLSAEHFSTSLKEDTDCPVAPVQNGTDQPASSEFNQNGHTQQQPFPMGTIAEQGEPAESETDTASRECSARYPNPGIRRKQDDQGHYYRQNNKSSTQDASPSRSSSSSISPSRRDRPKSLPLRAASVTTDLSIAHQKQTILSASSKCEDFNADGVKKSHVRRQQSVPPLASVDSVHETDL